MKNEYSIIYSPEALDDIRGIYSYSVVRIFYSRRDVEHIIKEDSE